MKRTGPTVLIAIVACASLAMTIVERGALGSVDQKGLRDVPVVMIVLDELPVASLMNERGTVDEHLFPNFARLQRDSTWFRNTTTPAVFTKDAVPAILTGLDPNNTRPDRQSVFSLVADEYDIPLTHEHHVVELKRGRRSPEDVLRGVCPSSACESASESMMKLADRYGDLFPGAHGDEFLRLLSFIRKDDEPRFYFLHYVMPHQPWRYFPTGQEYTRTNSLPGQVNAPGPAKEWIRDDWLVTQAYQRHLLQTVLLDRQLGVLIEHLEDQDLYDQSLLVITADHGVAFESAASKRIVTEETAGHVSAVPFFMKEPFQDGGRISDLPLETVDVVPTLIDALGSPEPPDTDGISAFSSDFPEQRVRTTDGTVLTPDVESKFDVARMKYEKFGRIGDAVDLFALGPRGTRSLVGESTAEFEVTAPSEVVADVNKAKRIERAESHMPRLPALLAGTLYGHDTHRRKIAVVLDDQVVAVTRSFRNPRGNHLVHFYALLPPSSFASAPNDLELYFVEDIAARTLTPLPVRDR